MMIHTSYRRYYKRRAAIINTKKHYKLFLTLLFAGVITLLGACASDDSNEKSDSSENNDSSDMEETDISIGLDPYDYATVPAYLSQVILEEKGYEVHIEEADVGILYEALSTGDIDAFIDVWRPNLHESYLDKYDDSFVTAGTFFSDMPLGVAVPEYMEDINSIADLKANADAFNHELFAIEPGSGMALTTEQMMKDYELEDDFEVKNSSTAAMLAQVDTAVDNEEPIVFNAWRPHPMFVRYDIKFLDDPKNSWKFDDIEIGVTPDFEEESPTAYTLFSNMDVDIDMVEDWLISIDEGESPRDLAESWVKEHQDIVDEWLEN